MKNFIRKLSILAVVLACGLIFGHAAPAQAETLEKYHFAITPTTTTLEQMIPGTSYHGSFEVVNKGSEPITFTVIPKPYSVVDSDYTPAYDQKTQYTEIVDWITATSDLDTLTSGQRAKIDFTIDVPADAHGGSQSAVIMVQIAPASDIATTGVEMVREIGHLIYGNVDGNVIETANVLENRIPGFLFNPPLYVESVVENTGNVYSRAEYTLQIFPLFSDEEIYTNEEDPEKQIVFPETQRYRRVAWEGSPQLGIFRVRQTVKLFGASSVEEKLVVICPLWFLFLCLAVLAIIIFSVVNHLRKRDRQS